MRDKDWIMEIHSDIDEYSEISFIPSSSIYSFYIGTEREKPIREIKKGIPDSWYYPDHILNAPEPEPTRDELIVQAERYAAEDAAKKLRQCPRNVILTDEDFDELRGWMRLGYRFDEEHCTEKIRNMFPVLDFYFAVKSQNTPSPQPITSWLIIEGDSEERAKTRLRHWAKSVALMGLERKIANKHKRRK